MVSNHPMLNIGSIKLDIPVIQAPLSGYTDWAMRYLAREFKTPLTFTGVMLAKSAANPKILKKPEFQPGMGEDAYPTGAQIMCTEASYMVTAAKALIDNGFDIIDLNFACPAPKVLRRRRGGSMLNRPDAVIEIYKRVRDAIDCPLTVKLRIGYGTGDESQEKFWKIVDSLAAEKVDALVIHGRTTLQKYTGKANWDIIKQVKQKHPDTKIIGSGDIHSPEDIINRMDETGIDGVLVARGAIGNPWIFSEVRALFEGKEMPAPPDVEEQGKVMLHHFSLLRKIYDPDKAVRYFRKFASKYCKRHPQRKNTQMEIFAANKETEFLAAMKNCYDLTMDDFNASTFEPRF